jgi:hypothetical protein
MTDTNGNSPDEIVIDPARPLRISPDAMRAVKAATGRQFTELMQDEDQTIAFQVSAFAELHRRYAKLGHLPDADALWAEAGGVELVFTAPADLDPTNVAYSPTSPPSAVTGE